MSISTLSPTSERSPGGEPELAPLPWPERPAPHARFERRRPAVPAPEPFAPPPFEAAWGDPSEALSRWRTSVTLSEALSEQRPDNMTWQRDVLRARRRIARAQLALGAFDEASATCEQAIERAERAREVDPSHLEVLEEAAALHETLGWAHGAAGRVRQAAAALREALAAWLRRARLLPDPDERPALQGLLVSCRRIARALARLGDAGGAVRAWDEALRCAQALAAAADAQPPDREALADVLAARGDALRRAGRLTDALESYREALAVLERAVAAGAEPDALAERLHGVQQRIAAALATSGRPAEAAAQHRAALAVVTRQAALAPGALRWQRAVAESHAGLAAALRAVGDREQAEAALRAALLARRSACRASGSLEDLRALVALQLESGDALWDAGDRPAAEAAYRAARTLCEDERTALTRPWSIVHERLGDLALEDDRLEAAQASYDEAWASWRLASGPLRERDEPALRERRAWLRLRQGRLEEAEREARAARALRERAVGAGESEAGERALFLAELLLGEVLEAAGRLPEAHAAYEAATAIAARRCSEGAYRPEARRELSIAAERCGATLEAQGDLAAALAAYERAAVLREAIAEREDAGAQALADRAEIELRVGALLLARGDEAAALARHERAVSLYERALRTGADGVHWLGAGALAAARLARVRERRGEFEAALAANAQALERLEALRAAGRDDTRWRAVRRLVLGDRARLRAVRDGRADSPRRALELRLQRDAPRFELLALLRVLHRLGYDEDSIVYRSALSGASATSLVQSLRFVGTGPARQAVLTLHLGLWSTASPLPSYFQRFVETQNIDEDGFVAFVRFFDHGLVRSYVRALMPEWDRALYPDWSRTCREQLQLFAPRSRATLWWLLRRCFPELGLEIGRARLGRRLQLEPSRLGRSRLGDGSALGGREAVAVGGHEVVLYADEETSSDGTPWPEVVRERLRTTVFPVLAPFEIPLRIRLVLRTERGWARLRPDSHLGYDRLPGGDASARTVLIHDGVVPRAEADAGTVPSSGVAKQPSSRTAAVAVDG